MKEIRLAPEAIINLDRLLETRMFVQGSSGAGKTHALRLIAEQAHKNVQVLVIDPESEFSTLREKFDFLLIGEGGEAPAHPDSAEVLALRLRELGVSAVCDLYELKRDQRHQWVKNFLESLIDSPREYWNPCIVIVDEAHLYCPEKGMGESIAKDAMMDLSSRGRKRGICPIFATQRLSKLDKNATAELLNRIAGLTIEGVDRTRVAKEFGVAEAKVFDVALRTAKRGDFFCQGPAIEAPSEFVHFIDTETKAPARGKKHLAPPPPTSKVRALIAALGDIPKQAEEKRKSEADLRARVRELETKLEDAEFMGKEDQREEVSKDAYERGYSDGYSSRSRDADVQIEELKQRFSEQYRVMEETVGHYRDRMTEMLAMKLPEPIVIDTTAATELHRRPLKYSPPPELVAEARVWQERKVTPNGETKFSKPQEAMVNAVAEFGTIGIKKVRLAWLAATMGTTTRARGFEENLRTLRNAGALHKNGDYVELGPNANVAAPRPYSGQRLRSKLQEMLSAPQWGYLSYLIDNSPKVVSLERLAEAFGTTVRARGFEENVRTLRSYELVEKSDGGLRAADWVMR